MNGNADLMSRLPLPATAHDASPEIRLTDPADLDVYMIGVSGVMPARMGPVLRGGIGGLPDHREGLEGGEKSVLLTSGEVADQTWTAIQNYRTEMLSKRLGTLKNSSVVVKDDTPLMDPGNLVVSGQLEPGLTLYAVQMTMVGRHLLKIKDVSRINVIESSGVGSKETETVPFHEKEEWESAEAKAFGERLCEKNVMDWAVAQAADITARFVIEMIAKGKKLKDIPVEEIPKEIDEDEVNRLVAQGEIMQLSDSSKLLIRRESRVSAVRIDRNPGQFERLLGDEPVRTFVPMKLRPWVMDCSHKEAVHLGEKVTLGVLKRLYWWIGMSESVKWWWCT